MKLTDSMMVIEALLSYWYNTEPQQLFDDIYGARPENDWVITKRRNMQHDGLIATYNQLDRAHRTRLVKKAIAKYGSIAARRIRFDASEIAEASEDVFVGHTDSPILVQA